MSAAGKLGRGAKVSGGKIAALEGRLAATEAVFMAFATHMAANFKDPVQFIARAMMDAENDILNAPQKPGEERERAWATAEFNRLSQLFLAHVARHVAPEGRG